MSSGNREGEELKSSVQKLWCYWLDRQGAGWRADGRHCVNILPSFPESSLSKYCSFCLRWEDEYYFHYPWILSRRDTKPLLVKLFEIKYLKYLMTMRKFPSQFIHFVFKVHLTNISCLEAVCRISHIH